MIFAYLDAGSGAILVQAILGGAAGILVAFRTWKARIMGKEMLANAGPDPDEQSVNSES